MTGARCRAQIIFSIHKKAGIIISGRSSRHSELNSESQPIVKECDLLNDLKLGYVCDKEGKPQSTAKASDFEVSFSLEKIITPSHFYANFGSPVAT